MGHLTDERKDKLNILIDLIAELGYTLAISDSLPIVMILCKEQEIIEEIIINGTSDEFTINVPAIYANLPEDMN